MEFQKHEYSYIHINEFGVNVNEFSCTMLVWPVIRLILYHFASYMCIVRDLKTSAQMVALQASFKCPTGGYCHQSLSI